VPARRGGVVSAGSPMAKVEGDGGRWRGGVVTRCGGAWWGPSRKRGQRRRRRALGAARRGERDEGGLN
jgi:hypothetical protein